MSKIPDREAYMAQALVLAHEAAAAGEVPVGCVIVREGKVIARGHNRREQTKNALSHAETEAIQAACGQVEDWRLSDCTLYVTLEPCPMCAGAIVNARIPRVVYGGKDIRFGAMGSLFDLNALPLNHHAEVESGVLAEECIAALKEFFAKKRGK